MRYSLQFPIPSDTAVCKLYKHVLYITDDYLELSNVLKQFSVVPSYKLSDWCVRLNDNSHLLTVRGVSQK